MGTTRDVGAVYLFSEDPASNGWHADGVVVPPVKRNISDYDYFGCDIAASDDQLVVGMSGANTIAGQDASSTIVFDISDRPTSTATNSQSYAPHGDTFFDHEKGYRHLTSALFNPSDLAIIALSVIIYET